MGRAVSVMALAANLVPMTLAVPAVGAVDWRITARRAQCAGRRGKLKRGWVVGIAIERGGCVSGASTAGCRNARGVLGVANLGPEK